MSGEAEGRHLSVGAQLQLASHKLVRLLLRGHGAITSMVRRDPCHLASFTRVFQMPPKAGLVDETVSTPVEASTARAVAHAQAGAGPANRCPGAGGGVFLPRSTPD